MTDSTGEPLPHTWTRDERLAQIREFADVCAGLAAGFEGHDSLTSGEFLERSERAESLLANGFDQADLNVLAGQFPMGAWWLNPKASDYNAPREPWQESVAELHERGSALARELRSIATY